ncbi:hypothetical protein J2W32_000959 [Variovorax boronicumulans]|uniref:Phasin domain-containing protein n=1 Tax=Variovorax boronicumulans TaxID=436515 RepID=A0AAW8CQL3_9BURK|nr:hypothetical protein [Variovorax boronicumulans]MDP9892597.1 hypothetical protein [Variovorax boronicumulans]MDQ0051923.1 hypothetical protein [Variovorax boronicumulans]
MTAKGQVLQLTQQLNKDGNPESAAEASGRAVIDPAVSAGLMSHRYTSHMPNEEVSINAGIDEVRRITNAVKAGDLSDLEGMLVAQAIALQTMAANFANRAHQQTGQRNLEAFYGLALKTQAQSRATIQALVELKFPRQVVFSKNANINNGQQQINNGVPSQAEQTESTQNKILESSNGQWLDTRAPGTAVPTHPHLASVGQGNRAEKPRRKSQGVA